MHKARYGFIFLKARQSTVTEITESNATAKAINFNNDVRKSPIIEKSKNKEQDKNNGRLLKTLIIITPSLNNSFAEYFFVANQQKWKIFKICLTNYEKIYIINKSLYVAKRRIGE